MSVRPFCVLLLLCAQPGLAVVNSGGTLAAQQPVEPAFLWLIDQAADTTFVMPVSVAADRGRSRVLVADVWGRVVFAIHGGSGELLARIGRDGDGPGEFRSPEMVAVAPDGGMFAVWDQGGRRADFFDAGAKFIRRLQVPGVIYFPKGMALGGDTTIVLTGGYLDAYQRRAYPGVHWVRPGSEGLRSTPPLAPQGPDRARELVAGGPLMLASGRAIVAEAASGDIWVGSPESARRAAIGPGAVAGLMERMVREVRTGRGAGRYFWWDFTRAVLLDTLPGGGYLVGMTDFDRDELRFFRVAPGASPRLLGTWRARVEFAAPYDRTSCVVIITGRDRVRQIGRARYPFTVP